MSESVRCLPPQDKTQSSFHVFFCIQNMCSQRVFPVTAMMQASEREGVVIALLVSAFGRTLWVTPIVYLIFMTWHFMNPPLAAPRFAFGNPKNVAAHLSSRLLEVPGIPRSGWNSWSDTTSSEVISFERSPFDVVHREPCSGLGERRCKCVFSSVLFLHKRGLHVTPVTRSFLYLGQLLYACVTCTNRIWTKSKYVVRLLSMCQRSATRFKDKRTHLLFYNQTV